MGKGPTEATKRIVMAAVVGEEVVVDDGKTTTRLVAVGMGINHGGVGEGTEVDAAVAVDAGARHRNQKI